MHRALVFPDTYAAIKVASDSSNTICIVRRAANSGGGWLRAMCHLTKIFGSSQMGFSVFKLRPTLH